jgi:hypothetical protein
MAHPATLSRRPVVRARRRPPRRWRRPSRLSAPLATHGVIRRPISSRPRARSSHASGLLGEADPVQPDPALGVLGAPVVPDHPAPALQRRSAPSGQLQRAREALAAGAGLVSFVRGSGRPVEPARGRGGAARARRSVKLQRPARLAAAALRAAGPTGMLAPDRRSSRRRGRSSSAELELVHERRAPARHRRRCTRSSPSAGARALVDGVADPDPQRLRSGRRRAGRRTRTSPPCAPGRREDRLASIGVAILTRRAAGLRGSAHEARSPRELPAALTHPRGHRRALSARRRRRRDKDARRRPRPREQDFMSATAVPATRTPSAAKAAVEALLGAADEAIERPGSTVSRAGGGGAGGRRDRTPSRSPPTCARPATRLDRRQRRRRRLGDGHRRRPAVAVIAGTGSNVFGVGPDGRSVAGRGLGAPAGRRGLRLLARGASRSKRRCATASPRARRLRSARPPASFFGSRHRGARPRSSIPSR